MHSSRMCTAHSSSHWGGVSTRPLLWPSGVVAFWCGAFWSGAFWCGGLLVWWPSVMAFCSPKAIPEGHLQSEGHHTRKHHTRRPQQKAITEGHTPLPLGADPPKEQTPQEQTPPGYLLQGMLAYHL